MNKIKRSFIRVCSRTNSIISVFKNNDGKIKPLLNLYGFVSNRPYMYPNFETDKEYYYKDFHRYYSYLVNDKNQYIFTQLTSYFIFSKLTKYSKILGIISRGEFIPYQTDYIDFNVLLKLEKFVVKRVLGGKGKYVYVCCNNGNNLFEVNSKTYEKEELIYFLKSLDNYIVQEFAKQHEYINSIYNKSTNTIRLVTMRTPNTNEVFIPWAVQRIGTNQSAPVDNWSAGGISSDIDLETGIISSAKYYDQKSKRLINYDNHPDSRSRIKDSKIPHWNIIKSELMLAHRALPDIHFIAWDVVVTENAFSIIEVNNTSDVDLIQVHRPLLKDQRIKDFFQYHKIVRQ